MGVVWILRWESNFELRLLLQILPILLIPLQTIFNNVAEELLSWIGGDLLCYDIPLYLVSVTR